MIVIEIADVFRRFADEYLSAHGASMPPSHRRVIADIQACRTEALGGGLWRCDQCATEVFSYRSCKNRSCPKCHTDQTERWLAARKAEMLPTRYFHVTVTVPEELRDTLRANQRDGYALLMKAAAEAIVELARDPRHVGATVGVLAVLHTWTQQLLYHPHVHCLVTGGGVSDDGADWRPARKAFLVPAKALAKLVRGKLRAALQESRPDLVVPDAAWSKPWVVHCTPWGEGEQAVLDYLARYVFRVAITNARIVGLDDEAVTLRHTNPTDGGPAASPARSSCAASSSMSCPRACTRSATSACGIPPGASMPPAPGCCFCSTLRRRRFEPKSARTPPIRPPTRNSRTIRASALAAARVVSCLSASFRRSRPKDHDQPTPPP